ncbi:MAG: dienelactone hydrolase family protein [bacterium]|nr:dienelactone hydrolase family protein [bacterium]
MTTKLLKIVIALQEFDARLTLPAHPKGLVIFSDDHKNDLWVEVNRALARFFEKKQFATLQCELLTMEEQAVLAQVNRELFSERLAKLTGWALRRKEIKDLDILLFGSGPGASLALMAAAKFCGRVRTVICMDGSPDLAGGSLSKVNVPVLFIVGGEDSQTIKRNQDAMWLIQTKAELEIMPGRLHVFEEPEILNRSTDAAIEWFNSCKRSDSCKQEIMNLNWDQYEHTNRSSAL